jgi:hypothetical protein
VRLRSPGMDDGDPSLTVKPSGFYDRGLVEARDVTILGTIYGRGCLAVWGKECPDDQAISQEADEIVQAVIRFRNLRSRCRLKLDPMFDNPVIRNRIGELISRSVENRIRKNASPVMSSKQI